MAHVNTDARAPARSRRRAALSSARHLSVRLEALEHAGNVISCELAAHEGDHPGPLLQVIVDQARQVIGAAYAAIGVVDPSAYGLLDPWVFSGLPAGHAVGAEAPGTHGVLGLIAQPRSLVRFDDVRQHPAHLAFPDNHPAVGPLICAPTRHGEAVLGYLYLANAHDEAPFTDIDEHCVEMVAARVGVTLEIARLRRVEARARARLDLLAEAGRVLSGTRDCSELCLEIARLPVPRLADVCLIAVAEGDGFRVTGVAHADPDRQARIAELTRSLLPGHSAPQEQILSRIAERAAVPSLSVIPMRVDQQATGLLLVGSASPCWMQDPHDRQSLEEYAHRCAMFLENSRLFQEAGAAIKARDGLLAAVAHDLRNHITGIQMAVGVIGRAVATGQGRVTQGQFEMVDASCTRTFRLLDDLLTGALIENGRFSVVAQPQALGPILDEALSAWVPVAADDEIGLDADLAPDLPNAMVDRARVLQVLGNLLGNAIRYAPRQSAVHLRAARDGDSVRVSVIDHGPGISNDDQAHIFDRYWRGQSGGSGLGLSIARGIVEAHGGRLWVESQLERGSTFSFTVPAALPPAPAEP